MTVASGTLCTTREVHLMIVLLTNAWSEGARLYRG